MLYNLKADIVYYKTGSDFELEFNLCGCCRMRLLTDKCANKKTFVHSLARAVARSRVILIAGPIFGDENTIQIVSQALGTSTEIANNKEYGIASDEEIEILKGSVPLVSAEGSFGGCIIESGPQTMILLTDNKTLRKSIMSTLIHPYISELYTSETAAEEKNTETANTAEEMATDLDEANNLTETPSDIAEDANNSDDVSTTFEQEPILTEESNDVINEADNLPLQTTDFVENDKDAMLGDELLLTEDEEEENEPETSSTYDDIGLIDIEEPFDTDEQESPDETDALKRVPIILSEETEEVETENQENTADFKDITINDLFSHDLEDNENNETAHTAKLEPQIFLEENPENEIHTIPKEYEKTFNKLFIEDENDEINEGHDSFTNIRSYTLLHDDEIDDNYTAPIQKVGMSKLQISMLVVTILLLVAIIVLCYSTFVVSANQGISAAEYIQTVFNTVFGKV